LVLSHEIIDGFKGESFMDFVRVEGRDLVMDVVKFVDEEKVVVNVMVLRFKHFFE
jgi:hypothetical protein